MLLLVAVAGVLALSGCTSAGSMVCSEFAELSKTERTDAFTDAVIDRGVSIGGPDFMVDMRVAAAQSYCMQNSGDSLDDALDFVGVPR